MLADIVFVLLLKYHKRLGYVYIVPQAKGHGPHMITCTLHLYNL